MVIKSINR